MVEEHREEYVQKLLKGIKAYGLDINPIIIEIENGDLHKTLDEYVNFNEQIAYDFCLVF